MKFRFNFLPVFLRLMIISGLILFLFNSISTKQATAQKSPPLVGLVPDGPIDDQGFNQMAYEGLMRADSENLIEGNVYLPAGNEYSDYALAISQCVSAGNSLCIAVGFMMGDPLLWAATNHPGTAFAIVDMTWDESTYPANLRGMHFSVDEAAYLAGTLAGLMTETNKIGIVAGMDIPPVNDFVIPYLYGAQWAAPEVYVMVNYANDFSNEAIGADLADFQMGRGADIIFGVGGQMGNGAIKQACSHGVYCVGADVDTYHTAFLKTADPQAAYALGIFYRFREPCANWYPRAVEYFLQAADTFCNFDLDHLRLDLILAANSHRLLHDILFS